MNATPSFGHARSFDGTRIAYQVFGDGPPVLVGNGIGVGYRSLELQTARLSRRFRVVTWDHRGIFGSEAPRSGDVSVAAQARDCLAVMDALHVQDAAFIGWSMGAQVGFELLRWAPERIARVAALGGAAGNPFAGVLPAALPRLHRLAPRAVDGAASVSPLLSPLSRRLVGSEAFFRMACASGYVSRSADRTMFMRMARGVAQHDHRLYLRTLAALGRHDATDLLHGLSIPVLFIAGGRDTMVPPRVLEALADALPEGRVHTVPDGTHFALIERPDHVNEVLEEFCAAPTAKAAS